MSDLLRMFGGTENTIQYAIEYMQIIIPGGILTALYFGFNNIMRASGFPRKAMYSIILGAVLNTILDPIFIFVFDMGIRGAAIATVISYFVGGAWVISHFFGKAQISVSVKTSNSKKKSFFNTKHWHVTFQHATGCQHGSYYY